MLMEFADFQSMSPATFHTATSDVPLRILPLGDSITAGTLLDGQNSYRPYLRDLLLDSGMRRVSQSALLR